MRAECVVDPCVAVISAANGNRTVKGWLHPMLLRMGLAIISVTVTSVSFADESPEPLPMTHLGLRGGVAEASQEQQYQLFGGSSPNYTLSGAGLFLGLGMTVGPSNFRWLVKVENVVIPSGDYGASGDILLATTGIQYNGSRTGTSFVGEASLGISFADGRMYDQGSNSCGLLSCSSSSPSSANWQQRTLATGVLALALGARIEGGFEILGHLWLGPLTAGGVAASIGYNFAL